MKSTPLARSTVRHAGRASVDALMRHGSKRLVGVLSLSVAALLLVGIGAVPAQATDPKFPSWADVLQAEHNAAAKKAEVAKILKLISGLQSASADSGKTALLAGERYNEAKVVLASATTKATSLNEQATAAKAKATASAREAGLLAAQMAREGYGNVSLALILNGHGAGNLLERLGTMSKLSETSSTIFTEASEEHQVAAALGAQATAAQTLQAAKAASAKSDYASATSAANDSKTKVNSESAVEKVLIAQLASLNGTTAATEAAYLAGIAWEKKQAGQKTPPKSPPAPPVEPGAPVTSQVAEAIAFARKQLGDSYVLGGYGPNVWDCSGLTKASWAAAGVNIGPHGSTSQYTFLKGENRLVPIGDRQPGDLLFYSDGGSTTATKYHVTLYIGNGEMIEAPYPGVDVRIAAVRFGDLVPYAGRPTG